MRTVWSRLRQPAVYVFPRLQQGLYQMKCDNHICNVWSPKELPTPANERVLIAAVGRQPWETCSISH
jgi:hypothetical protein